ncbi:MAG TPA: paraquat-inducible protein A, partial [Geopsychrobacteraceae bacterium]
GAILLRPRIHMISRTLPLVLSGLLLFFMANAFPFMAVKTGGIQQDSIFISGIFQLFQSRMWGLGAVVVLTTLLAPLLQLCGLSYILGLLSLGKQVPGGKPLLKSIIAIEPWSMLDIYMIGILVALIKLLKIGTVIPGVALYSFAGLILVQIGIGMLVDHQQLWERLEPS